MISCIIISGMLWIGANNIMLMPRSINKEPGSSIVVVQDQQQHIHTFETEFPYQLNMDSHEFVNDCIQSGTTMDIPDSRYDDIDDEEPEFGG